MISDKYIEAVNELKIYTKNLNNNTVSAVDTDKVMNLQDVLIKHGEKDKEATDLDLHRIFHASWDLALAIIQHYPDCLSWRLAAKISDALRVANNRKKVRLIIFREEIVIEATKAAKGQPNIPKACAIMLIAMVLQNYLTEADLEGYALVLLRTEWPKDELEFIGKCLKEVKAALLAKLGSENELHLIIDWVAETFVAMVADEA